MDGMKPPQLPEQPVDVVRHEQLARLLKASEGCGFTSRRDSAIILLLVDTDMRLAECVGMTLDDVDLDQRIATGTTRHLPGRPRPSPDRRVARKCTLTSSATPSPRAGWPRVATVTAVSSCEVPCKPAWAFSRLEWKHGLSMST
jgi:integrase